MREIDVADLETVLRDAATLVDARDWPPASTPGASPNSSPASS